MKILKLANQIAKVLDRLTPVNYNKDMTDKPIITRERFKAVKEIYDEAVEQRQAEVKRLYLKKWNPQRIADELGMDESQVSRFIAKIKKGE